jgi:Phosphodiester glycosidase
VKNPVTTYIKFIVAIAFICIFMAVVQVGADQQTRNTDSNPVSAWQNLSEGLDLGFFRSPLPTETGDSMIRVLRIEPARYNLRLLNASASENGRPLSAKEWCRQNGLVAAINASMYQADLKASVSLMRTKNHINNPKLSKDMAVLAFDRNSKDVPRVKIIDRQCEDFKVWKKKYKTLIQSIRMISCEGKNVWAQQTQKWSTAAIAVDYLGRVLFIHVGSLYSTHDLINILKKLPLNIDRAMYVEGGPQAQLYINIDTYEHEFVGSYKINIEENVNALFSRPIPNVVGISLRKE